MKKFKELAYIAAIASMAIAPVAIASSAFAAPINVASGGNSVSTVTLTGEMEAACSVDVSTVDSDGDATSIIDGPGGAIDMGAIASSNGIGVVEGLNSGGLRIEVAGCSTGYTGDGASVKFTVVGANGTDVPLAKAADNTQVVSGIYAQLIADQSTGSLGASVAANLTGATSYLLGTGGVVATVYNFTPKYNITSDISGLSGGLVVKDGEGLSVDVSVA